MVGYAVSSFVDGFFKGRDWRDAKEQRKKDEERQTRLDKMNEDLHGLRLREFGLREEEFGLRREDVMRQRAEQDRLREMQAADDAFRSRVMSTAPGAIGAIPSQRDMGVISIGEGPQLSLGVSTGAPTVQGGGGSDAVRGGAGNDVFSRITNVQPVQGAYERTASVSPGPTFERYGREVGNASPSDQAAAARIRNEVAADQYTPPAAPIRPGAGRAGFPSVRTYTPEQLAAMEAAQPAVVPPDAGVLPPPVVAAPQGDPLAETRAAIRGQVAEALQPYQPDYDRRFFQPGGLVGDVREIGNRVGPAAFGALYDTAATAANTVNSVINPAVNYATGSELPPVEMAPRPERSARSSGPAFETKGRGTAPAPVAAAEQTAATSPAAQASTEATKQGVALTFGDLGLKPGDRYTGKQVQAASKSAADWYYETAAPQFLEYYVSTGQMDKAQAFAEILESRAGKKAMELRAGAAFKAINGDIDGYASDILEAYKAYGFVDPTFDIDEEATSIIRDESGGFAGAKLVFKDRKTGNTMEKLFETEADLIDYGMVTTDPATLVETMSAQRPEPKGVMTQKDVLEAAINLVGKTPGMTLEQGIAEISKGLGSLGTVGVSQGIDPRITGAGNDGLYSIN
jgi:hypothetical protein